MKNSIPQHYAQTTVQHIPSHKGWPNGEPGAWGAETGAREAYDAQLAAQGGTS